MINRKVLHDSGDCTLFFLCNWGLQFDSNDVQFKGEKKKIGLGECYIE